MTRNPPSGQFPTGFVPTTASFCTGCDVTWDNSGLNNSITTGRPFNLNYPGGPQISGWGAGQYAGPIHGYANGTLTGSFPNGLHLGTMSWIYNGARDGRCVPQTGAILYSGTSGTGVLIYTNTTGCTGTSGCYAPMTPYFMPNSAFYYSTGLLLIAVQDYCVGYSDFIVLSFPNPNLSTGGYYASGFQPSLGWPLEAWPTSPACGQTCFYDAYVEWFPVAASGNSSVRGITGWAAGCTVCSGNP